MGTVRAIPGRAIDRVQQLLSRLAGREIGRRETVILLGVMALGLAIRIAYVLATRGDPLVGDGPEYDFEGRYITEGKWFWTDRPYGIPHEGLWKTPGYPAWIGLVYTVLGISPTKLYLVQACVGPITIALVWLLGRRLFDSRVALLAAAAAAVVPNFWAWEVEMLPEVFSLPIALIVMLIVLEQEATLKRALVAGAMVGVGILVRPSHMFLFGLIFIAWWLSAGFRRGIVLTAASIAVAAAVVSPWTVHNYIVADDFIPLSMQDSVIYGTFNDEAKNDPRFPWAWRPLVKRDVDLFNPLKPLSDAEFRDKAQQRAYDYIEDNPTSVIHAWFWNGLSRLWDIRRPSNSTFEYAFDGRDEWVAKAGLYSYWVLLAGALAGLWRLRRRRTLVLPLLGAALAASIVFSIGAVSRYRLPFEPMIAILAISSYLALWDSWRQRRRAA